MKALNCHKSADCQISLVIFFRLKILKVTGPRGYLRWLSRRGRSVRYVSKTERDSQRHIYSNLPQTLYLRYHWYHVVSETLVLYIHLSLRHTPVGNLYCHQVMVGYVPRCNNPDENEYNMQ